ncbi:MAG: acyltransferase [Acetatifactor sp.]|nr:acyltransferase [Acetatifactor sp.]
MSENTVANQSKPSHAHTRQANLELLRCVAMMMVIVLHYLGKGNLLVSLDEEYVEGLYPAEYVAWLLESFCIVAVNVYMFISGYFLCTSSFKPSRLVQLWLQVWMYSVAFGLIGALTGVMEETAFDTHFLLTLIFPVAMNHYWFMTAYIFLYVLLPFLGSAVQRMTKRQLQIAALLLLFVFSVQKSVLPVQLETDGLGYDCLWYVCVFVAAAYVRRFGVPFLEKKGRGIVLYVVCSLLIFGGTFGLRQVYLKTGRLERMIKMCMAYNHILPFLAAVGLFCAFRRLKVSGKFAAFVCKIAPYTLGVYLLHENLGLRYTWQNWLGADKLLKPVPVLPYMSSLGRLRLGDSVVGLLLHVAAAVVCVFTVGILVDMLRAMLGRGLDRILSVLPPYSRLKGFVLGLDQRFREGEPQNGRV